MKIYLDTNIILDWFMNFMRSSKEGKEFKMPRKIKFLSEQNLELVVSDITKVEIMRYLVSEWNAKEGEAEELWGEFMRGFNISYLVVERVSFDRMAEICTKIPTRKKTLTNLLHLQVAKEAGLWFLTGEKNLITKYKTYYKNTVSYPELRKKLEVS